MTGNVRDRFVGIGIGRNVAEGHRVGAGQKITERHGGRCDGVVIGGADCTDTYRATHGKRSTVTRIQADLG